jgi:hypothetical protein
MHYIMLRKYQHEGDRNPSPLEPIRRILLCLEGNTFTRWLDQLHHPSQTRIKHMNHLELFEFLGIAVSFYSSNFGMGKEPKKMKTDLL